MKKIKRKRKVAAKKATIFAQVSPSSKAWLNRQCREKLGTVSKATMLECILQGLRKKPNVFKQLGI